MDEEIQSLPDTGITSLEIIEDGRLEDFPLEVGNTARMANSDSVQLQFTELLALPDNDTRRNSEASDSWELNYREAAIFLEEGINNDKLTSHPNSHEALPAYLLVHNHWYYALDLVAALLLVSLAFTEKPAHSFFQVKNCRSSQQH